MQVTASRQLTGVPHGGDAGQMVRQGEPPAGRGADAPSQRQLIAAARHIAHAAAAAQLLGHVAADAASAGTLAGGLHTPRLPCGQVVPIRPLRSGGLRCASPPALAPPTLFSPAYMCNCSECGLQGPINITVRLVHARPVSASEGPVKGVCQPAAQHTFMNHMLCDLSF